MPGLLIIEDGAAAGGFLQVHFSEVVGVVLSLAAAIGVFVLTRRAFARFSSGDSFRNQWLQLLVAAICFALLIIVAMRFIPEQRHSSLLGLLGIVLSGAIALSSTTFLGNAMAGVMLRSLRNFKPGDFIEVKGYFGRVSEHGLLHTEIQTQDRDLTTLPNLFLVTNPVKVVRASGTILSAQVSIGYDVSRRKVEVHLLEAARRAGLDEPFVQVLELGDFSVAYRVAGLLAEVRQIMSSRSELRMHMLDTLHEGGVEIMSPTFMTTRALAYGSEILPEDDPRRRPSLRASASSARPELVFDKAERAAELARAEDGRLELERGLAELEAKHTAAEGAEQERLAAELERARVALEEFKQAIESLKQEAERRAQD